MSDDPALRQDKGLPRNQAWFNVKRQALTTDQRDPALSERDLRDGGSYSRLSAL